jgi:hypothetical protein
MIVHVDLYCGVKMTPEIYFGANETIFYILRVSWLREKKNMEHSMNI